MCEDLNYFLFIAPFIYYQVVTSQDRMWILLPIPDLVFSCLREQHHAAHCGAVCSRGHNGYAAQPFAERTRIWGNPWVGLTWNTTQMLIKPENGILQKTALHFCFLLQKQVEVRPPPLINPKTGFHIVQYIL